MSDEPRQPAPYGAPGQPPAPGSDAAISAGCICPVLDNGHGRGYYGDGARNGWVITEGCPIHPWIGEATQ